VIVAEPFAHPRKPKASARSTSSKAPKTGLRSSRNISPTATNDMVTGRTRPSQERRREDEPRAHDIGDQKPSVTGNKRVTASHLKLLTKRNIEIFYRETE